jgi:tetratricopeptide (TPR) repeat protein
LAFILICEHQWEKAQELLNQAHQNEFEDLGVLFTNRGYIFIFQNQYDEAVKILEGAINVSEDKDEAILHIAYAFNRELCVNNQDDYPIRYISVKMAIFANLATAYYLIGQNEKAFTAAQEAITADPEDCIGYRILGCLHFSQNDYKLAREAWNKALRSKKSKGEAKVIKSWLAEIPLLDKN